MAMSDFRPEVEIRLFRGSVARAMLRTRTGEDPVLLIFLGRNFISRQMLETIKTMINSYVVV